jgi:glycosyltransferase involved in cell wall biosynthesis
VTPRVSVVIRSFNRLVALGELLEALRRQRHDSFEVIVVEQSTERPRDAVARLDRLAGDPRIRVLRRWPLGGARARNHGVAAARGEVIVFIDDDDLPAHDDFLTQIEAPFVEDPRCMGVTCRQVDDSADRPSSLYRAAATLLCMRFSPLLRLPHNFPRHDRRIVGVSYVHGTGGAYRRAVFERFGGWDEDTPIEDETSLGIRIGRGLAPGEYLAFDPRARLRRRFDIAGGLAKRWQTPAGYFRRFMTFVHRILGRYHPWRVRLLYPLYVLGAVVWTLAWLWDGAIAHVPVWRKVLGTLGFVATLPWHAGRMLGEPLGRRGASPSSRSARHEAARTRAAPPV